MKKIHNLPAYIGLAGIIAALALIFMDQLRIAGIVCIPCYFLVVHGVRSVSKPFNIVAACFADAVFAFLLSLYHPLLAISVFGFHVVGIYRLIFLRQMAHTRFLWIEALAWLTGIAFYFYVNVAQPYGYQGGWEPWVFALPPLLFKTLLGYAIITDGLEYRRKLKKELNVQPGQAAPDFELPDADGKAVKLSDYQNKKIVLLLFVRGDWCPFCHMMLRAYQLESARFARKNVQLIAISPDITATNKTMADKLGLDYVLLSDSDLKVVGRYGLQIKAPVNAPGYVDPKEISLPASFLIDKAGTVRYVQRADDMGLNIRFDDVFDILEEIQ